MIEIDVGKEGNMFSDNFKDVNFSPQASKRGLKTGVVNGFYFVSYKKQC